MASEISSRFPVYLVDDDRTVRESIDFLLGTLGVDCTIFNSGVEFLAAVPSLPDGCLLLDLMMPDVDGFDVMRYLAAAGRHMPVTLMTANANPQVMRLADGIGAHTLLEKPFDEERLIRALNDGFALLERGDGEIEGARATEAVAQLDAKHLTLLRGLLAGMSTAALAAHLHVPEIGILRMRLVLQEIIDVEDVSGAMAVARLAGLQPLQLSDSDKDED